MIDPRLGESVTVSVPVVIVTVALADFVLSATEVAVTVTVLGLGAVAGALYVTLVVVTLVNEPQAVPLQPVPETDHVTPLLCTSLVTAAVKFCVPAPAATFALVGATETEMGGGGTLPAARKAAICMIHAPEDSEAVAL